MSRTVLAVFLLVAGSASADEGRPVKILNRGPWPHLPTHTSAGIGTDRAPITRVIRTEAELAKAAGGGARITAAKAFKLDAIDFDKHMIVAVEDGTQPMVGVSGGGPPSAPYTVSIVRIDRDGREDAHRPVAAAAAGQGPGADPAPRSGAGGAVRRRGEVRPPARPAREAGGPARGRQGGRRPSDVRSGRTGGRRRPRGRSGSSAARTS